ncbi:MAG TPA: hypothetical protein VJQ82_10780 [Terriglobales bacterium]|nr:hypothetical protein [Terriglobales bacterium]
MEPLNAHHRGKSAQRHTPRSTPAHEDAAHDPHAAHDKHAGHSVAMFRNKFWVSLALTIPTLV